jgi:hypothetical protein
LDVAFFLIGLLNLVQGHSISPLGCFVNRTWFWIKAMDVRNVFHDGFGISFNDGLKFFQFSVLTFFTQKQLLVCTFCASFLQVQLLLQVIIF